MTDTDMLGTSLGSTVEDQYNNISKTSFGADSSDTSAFFTGKPYINELGYTFLFRNYRADMGKWLSQDLIGYPDGWNNFSYCNNITTSTIDIFGCALYYASSNSYVNGAVAAINNYCKDNPNSNIARLINDPYSPVFVDSKKIKPTDNPDLKGTLNGFDPNPNDAYYDMPTVYLDEDHAANTNYTIDDGNGGTKKGSVSLGSIFAHELMHAYDYYYNPDYDNLSREELEERAMEEANKYRRYNNEAERVSYE